MKTLTPRGIEKIGLRFVESISHALYQHDGVPKTIPIFRTIVDGDMIKVYVYFDDDIEGTVGMVELIDKDGDVVATAEREFIKPEEKGLYVAFKYRFVEEEVDSVEPIR